MARLPAPDEEETFAAERSVEARRAEGAYYTPRPLAEHLVAQALPLLPKGPVRVVDPACGAGAFLSAAAKRLPKAELCGIELSATAAATCRARVPRARVLEGDALAGTLGRVFPTDEDDTFELWIGNPPWNGTSSLLRRTADYAAVRARLAGDLRFPPGTSLRDDFAFFLLLARERLSRRRGALVFVTPATLLDAYLYAPLRQALLESFALTEVLELGSGVFAGTRVRACATLWRTRTRVPTRPRYRQRLEVSGFSANTLTPPKTLRPRGPDWLLKPVPADALALDAAWRDGGELLTELVPLSFSGLKTRFDALLVDSDPRRLLGRMTAFLEAPVEGLEDFARAHAIDEGLTPKLRTLRASIPEGHRATRDNIRPFFRYAGARHRGTVPKSARVFCYLDRALIPRGDHRLRGDFDPHREPTKLLFNVRELPLSAALLTEPGCVPAHRHSRFAPLHVPARLLEEGIGAAKTGAALGPPVPNLSRSGLAWAERLGGPHALFERLAEFINSETVQRVWAPVFAAQRTLPVNLRCLLDEAGQRPMVQVRSSRAVPRA